MGLNSDMGGPREDARPRPRLRQAIDDDVQFGRRVKRRLERWRQQRQLSLFQASVWTLIVLAVFSCTLWVGLAWALSQTWPWNLSDTQTTEYSVARMVLLTGAGAVGVIGVIVAYRRQQTHEKGQFLERLAEAARLLGDQNPTIQAAGIYALAGLADTEGRARRQQCVDVLCAYIRLPYMPSMEDEEGALVAVVRKRTLTTCTGPVEEERTLTFRPHDRQTRETIIQVITQHLQSDAAVNWSDLDFDFTKATFSHGDFSHAVFSGKVSFRRTLFITGEISFGGARFADGRVSFRGATFTGGDVYFGGARFTGGEVTFRGAKFVGGKVLFEMAKFIDGEVSFRGAEFTGSEVSFRNAAFARGVIDFRDPVAWSRPPDVPWSRGDDIPAGVMPRRWPPYRQVESNDDT